MIKNSTAPATPWQVERHSILVSGMGAGTLLQGPLVAFFASRQCPGAAIRMSTEWALEQARRGNAVIGGFHSPLEQSVLRLLLEARSPVVVVIARPLTTASFNADWRAGLEAGTMAVVSTSATPDRLTERTARERNQLAARLADHVMVAHASPGGQLSRQCDRWLADGIKVEWIGADGNIGRPRD